MANINPLSDGVPTPRRQAAPALGWCILIALLGMGLTACGSEQTNDLQAYVKAVKARQKSNIPPLPKPQKYEQFTYNSTSLRDPFEPTEDAKAKEQRPGNDLQPDLKRDREALEQYSIGSLKMVGTLEKNGRRWALIIAPDGTLHRTTAGRHMGQDNGQIVKITENQVDLREIVPDGLGGWTERQLTLSVSE